MNALARLASIAVLFLALFAAGGSALSAGQQAPARHSPALAQSPLADSASPPSQTVKLIFIHHSTGENWLSDDNGGLGVALRDNNYFVSDTNYGWGPDGIGDRTDIGHWWSWFRSPSSSTYLHELFPESGQYSGYSRMETDPGGENRVIMFKSCFPNSQLQGSPGDPPTTGTNPLAGEDYSSGNHTVANAKGIYVDLLTYFTTRQDRLFVAITAPPLTSTATDDAAAANARAFNNWLLNDWLAIYPHKNVAVFDFYNVMTSNGGNPETNDLGQAGGNHHRWLSGSGSVQHTQPFLNNYASYPTEDSHPSQAGNLKATGEYVPVLNVFFNRWIQSSGIVTPSVTATAISSATPAGTSTPTVASTSTATASPPPTGSASATAAATETVTATPTATATPEGTWSSPTPSSTPASRLYLPALSRMAGGAW